MTLHREMTVGEALLRQCSYCAALEAFGLVHSAVVTGYDFDRETRNLMIHETIVPLVPTSIVFTLQRLAE